MGEVWRARDTHLGREVAVKVLADRFSNDPVVKQRLLREARAAAALNHRNVCTLYDIGRHDGRDYLVMEYLEGETLASRLERGALPYGEAMAVAREVAAALDHAHGRGVIHRDVKPANVMLTAAGAKLLDFGLAALRVSTGAPDDPRLTAEGTIVGTIEYTAPEQLIGEPADERADIFSFGVVLYEMLTGARPFGGHNRASVMGAILLGERSETLAGPVPASARALVMQCLEKNRDRRPSAAAELVRRLVRPGAPGIPG